MEKSYFSILNLINVLTKNGEAVVVEKSELQKVGDLKNNTELKQLIEKLSLTELIKVKYFDDVCYCLSLTSKGKLTLLKETKPESVSMDLIPYEASNSKQSYKKIGFVSFFAAFFGTSLAMTLYKVVELFLK